MYLNFYDDNNLLVGDSCFSITKIMLTIDDDKMYLESITADNKYFIISKELLPTEDMTFDFYKVRVQKGTRCNIIIGDSQLKIRYFDVEYHIYIKRIN